MTASKRQIGGDHYARFAIQPSEFIHRNRLGFLEGNVIKYVCRHGAKHGRQDLLKARHYIDLLLEWEYEDGATDGAAPDTGSVRGAGGDGPDAGDSRGGPAVAALVAARTARRG